MKTVIMGLVLILSITASSKVRDTKDFKKGKLGHLSKYIGTYNYDAILDDTVVKENLKTLVGEKELATIRQNLGVIGPIEFIETSLVLSGQAPHEGGSEEAMVFVELSDGTVRAGLLHEKKVTIYAKDSSYEFIGWSFGMLSNRSCGQLLYHHFPCKAFVRR